MRTEAAPNDDRPIGEERDVALALLAGGAERAGCDASHGHEVSAIVVPAPAATREPGASGEPLDTSAMRAMTAPLCDGAFAAYVGHALEGSRLTTFPVVPNPDGAEAWVARGMRTICLVARIDGQWLDHRARGSGQ